MILLRYVEKINEMAQLDPETMVREAESRYHERLETIAVKIFDNEEDGYDYFKQLEDKTGYGYRKLRFNELEEIEKMNLLKERLEKLNTFLSDMKGSGRTYYSHTNIYAEELEWLIDKAAIALNK